MKKNCCVITTTHIIDHKSHDIVLKLTKKAIPIFKKQQGLIKIYTLLSHDGLQISNFMIWKDENAHLQCMQSPDFSSVNSEWETLLESGKIKFEANTYTGID